MKISKENILGLFRERPYEPIHLRKIIHIFGLKRPELSRLETLLEKLVAEGVLLAMKENLFALPSSRGSLTGRLSTHRDGYGFVALDEGGEDLFIPARYLRENLHGDRVEVAIAATRRDGKREGRIIRTLERGQTRIVGRYVQGKKFGRVIPDELRINHEIFIPSKMSGKAENGQIVVVDIVSYPSSHKPAEGRVVEVLGWPDSSDVEVMTIIRKHGLSENFPDDTMAAASLVHEEVNPADLQGRIDLREKLTVTIDGETARDFDDAVAIAEEKRGAIRLWVSIADVSHYVLPGSPLDREAFLRGTSVYFPDRCIPMLPESLSNGICSLNPSVDRLTVTAEMLFDNRGELRESFFYPSVIRSTARLTYNDVKKVLVEKDSQLMVKFAPLLDDLSLMEKLAKRLMERRKQRGSIDFDLPEPEIIINIQGETLDIVRAERNLAHRIIEEFMLAANESVATYLAQREIPSLYRIHEHPDPAKIIDFREFVFNFGYELRMVGENIAPNEFQRLLDQAEGKPEERMINEVLLRCMKQARYSHENLGHFGLASPCYTHFTSPIRRYPDLVVHRILKKAVKGALKERETERLEAALPEIASHSSKMERVAMDAEREIVNLKKIQFMQDKIGEEFDGFITGISSYGFFVELCDYFVEGMVHVSRLPTDFYRYLEKQHALYGEKSRKYFRIGDKIKVEIINVSLEKKQIDFSPVLHAELNQGTEGFRIKDDQITVARVKKSKTKEKTAAGKNVRSKKKGHGRREH